VSNVQKQIDSLSPQQPSLRANALSHIPAKEQSEPIAIIGMGCRLPGGVHDGESFWELLSAGRDAIREVPQDRWDVDAYYDPNPDAPGRMVTRWGGFIDNPDLFDPKFFGIAPAEATAIDPQHRLLLETAWEAIEDSGINPTALTGSKTGVFVGIYNTDFFGYLAARCSREQITPYFASGLSHAVAAGRISYLLGLRGPSMAVDTSCSSSLMAVHLACQSLRRAESDLALAGGANLILIPEVTIALSRSRMMSPEGRCKVFSDRANGYVRSEGSGIVVLKRLSEAIEDRDRILGVIRGTAVNHVGKGSGLMAPLARSQEAVMRDALLDAGMRPDEIQYVEAHGTGTAVGDPVEIAALAGVFADRPTGVEPLRVGSVKSNLGHMESAAGIAGLLKLVLALRHKEIPASLHLEQPSRRIDWSTIPIQLCTSRQPWPASAGKRAGCVNSFGFSGANVHAVVEQAPKFADNSGRVGAQTAANAISAVGQV
jgi:acyl transferase domain-containing protein